MHHYQGLAKHLALVCLVLVLTSQLSAQCAQNVSWTNIPPPNAMGQYQSNVTVQFCFSVGTYNNLGADWFHGLEIIPGNGWNAASIVPISAPNGGQGCSGNGIYLFVPTAQSCKGGPNYQSGWWYDRGNGSSCCSPAINGIIGDDWGDAAFPTPTCNTFCWDITTNINCLSGTDLSMTVNTTSDRETGCWGATFTGGCNVDPNFTTLTGVTLVCCDSAQVATVDATCCGAGDGAVTIIPQGVGPWNITFISPNNPPVNLNNVNGPVPIPNLDCGTYTAQTVDLGDNNCPASTTFQINEMTNVTADAGMDVTICEKDTFLLGGGPTLTPPNAGAVYSWTSNPPVGVTYLDNASIANPTFIPPTGAAAVYTFYLDVMSGVCPAQDTIVVTVNPVPTVVTGPNTTICGGSAGPIGGGAVPGYTYTWTSSPGYALGWLSATNSNMPTVLPPLLTLDTVVYYLTVDDGTCTNTDSVIVYVTDPVADAGPDVTVCEGQCIVIGGSPTGPITSIFNWNGGGFPNTLLSATNVANPTFCAPAMGFAGACFTYTVQVTDGSCVSIDMVDVCIAAGFPPAVNAGPDTIICAGSSQQVGSPPAPGFTYNWTALPPADSTMLSATNVANPVITAPAAGFNGTTLTFQLIVDDGNCSASDQIDLLVTAYDDPTFSYSDTNYCTYDPDPFPINVATPGGTFSTTGGLVVNPATGQIDISTGIPGNSYDITYWTSGICPDSSVFTVNMIPIDDPSFDYLANICRSNPNATPFFVASPGGTFSATGGLPINPVTGEITNSSATTNVQYIVTHTTNLAGCIASTTDTIVFFDDDDPTFNYSDTIFCSNDADPAPAFVALLGGTFYTAGVLVVNAATGVIDLSSAPAGSYVVSYLTNGPCPQTFDTSITIINGQEAYFTYPFASYCISAGVNPLPDSVTTAGGTFAIVAGGPATINPVTGEINLSSTTAGATYTVTHSFGGLCPDTDTFLVSITSIDDASFAYSDTVFCTGNTNPAPASVALPGGTFSASGGLVINAATGVIDISSATIGTSYTITYNTAGPCPNSSDTNFVVLQTPDPTFTFASATYCVGDVDPMPNLVATPGGTFSVVGGGLVVNPVTGLIDVSTGCCGNVYTIKYLFGGICPDSTTFNVVINDMDDASFAYSDTLFCNTDPNPSPTVVALPGGMFSATPGLVINAATGAVDVALSPPGSYTITYTTAGICPNTFDTTFVIEPTLNPTFTYAQAVYCSYDSDPLPNLIATPGGTFSASGGLVINPVTGLIDVSTGGGSTIYTITYAFGGNCPSAAIFNIIIHSVDNPFFAYPSDTFCVSEPNPFPSVVSLAGGSFSVVSGPAGLIVNPATGVVDLSSAMPGAAGSSYTVQYLTSGNCPDSTTFSFVVMPQDDPAFSYAQAAYCIGGVVGNPLPNSITTPGGSFSVVGGPAGLVVNAVSGQIDLSTGSNGGVYTIQYLTGGICPDSATTNVTLFTIDNPSFAYPADTFCLFDNDPAPVGIATPGGSYNISAPGVINAATGVIDITASGLGNFTVEYVTTGTCPDSLSIPIVIFPQDDPVFSYANDTFCLNTPNQAPLGVLTPGGTFSVLPLGLSVNAATGLVDLDPANSVPGNYTITHITTSSVCEDTATFNLVVLPEDIPAFTFASDSFCLDDPNPMPAITQPANANFTISGGGSINASSGVIDLVASGVGSYIVCNNTVGNCPATACTTIVILPLDDPAFTFATDTFCANQPNPVPVVTVPGIANFSISAPGVINAANGTIDVVASPPGSYTVCNNTTSHCPQQQCTTIVILPADDPSFSYAQPSYCISHPVVSPVVTGLAGGMFSVSPGGLSVNTASGDIDPATGTIGTTYTITYTTNGACPSSTTQNVTITALDDVTFSYSNAAYCVDDPATLPTLAPTAVLGGTFSITPVAGLVINPVTGSLNFTGATPGSYTVTYATTGPCANSSSVMVDVLPPDDSTFNYGAANYCIFDPNPSPASTTQPGGSFAISAPGVINIVTGQINIMGSGPGNFTITYTTNGPCPRSSTQNVTILDYDNASFSYSQNAYCTSFGLVNPLITGLAGGSFSIAPAPPGLLVSTATGQLDPAMGTIGSTYTITYTTNGPCPNTATFDVTITSIDDAAFSYSDTLFCINDVDQLPAFGPTTPTMGTFSVIGGGLSVNAASGLIDVSSGSAGSAYDIVYATGGPCSNSDTFTVWLTDQIDASFSYPYTQFCINEVGVVGSPVNSGGTFSASGGLVIDPVTGVIDPATGSAGSAYTVTYSLGGACPSSFDLIINILALPDATITPQSFCANDSASNLTVAIGGGVFFGTGITNQALGTFDPATVNPGTYTITYALNLGNCADTGTTDIIVHPLPIPAMAFDSMLCIGDTMTLAYVGTQPLQDFAWDFNNTSADYQTGFGISNYTLAWYQPGTYSVGITVTSLDGCVADTTATINVVGTLINTIDNTTINYGDEIDLNTTTIPNVNSGMTFSWSPSYALSCTDCQNPIANPTTPTTYTVTVVDSFGCVATDTVTIDIFVDKNLYIPNAFSPNGDGKNELFKAYGRGFANTQLQVFNRWGELVFETNDMQQGWDGSFKGKLLAPGVFIYSFSANFLDGEPISKTGNVTLIR